MKKTGFQYNMNTCLACGSCQLACKNVHELKTGEFYRRVDIIDGFPYSGSCNHCSEAACVRACPTGAMYKAEDGTTRHDDGKCIGCGSCMWNCPYGAVSFSKTKGVTQKCDSCFERRENVWMHVLPAASASPVWKKPWLMCLSSRLLQRRSLPSISYLPEK